jgi:polyisoprenoid-binding protein YceI
MATSTKWVIDPMHSEVRFKVRHLVISSVTGSFKSFDGGAESVNEDFSDARIDFSLDTDSIDTNQEQRDVHLKSAEFFDAEKFPHLTFSSTSFTKEAEGYNLKGNLTVKNITRQVSLTVEYGGTAGDFYGNTKAGFEISGKINRKEFGLIWEGITEAGSVVVGEDVTLMISVQLIKQS